MKEDFIVKITGGYVRENNGKKELHVNERSHVLINPKGENVGDVLGTKVSRKEIKDLVENDSGIELLATIVQVFDLRFYEICSKCGKRAKASGDSFSCPEHGIITPSYAYVLNTVLDDGTETIRCVFFRSQLERLLNMSQSQILNFKQEPADFESVKNELLGTIVKINGRVAKNSMFNRLEFVANIINNSPNPQEEIRKLL
jgi:replication factor A1